MQKADRPEIDEGTYLPLSMAAEAAAARGIAPTVTVKSLRRKASRGRLPLYRFSGRDHTTLDDIRRMFELCRVHPRAPTADPLGRGAVAQHAASIDGSIEKAAALEAAKQLKARHRKQLRAEREARRSPQSLA